MIIRPIEYVADDLLWTRGIAARSPGFQFHSATDSKSVLRSSSWTRFFGAQVIRCFSGYFRSSSGLCRRFARLYCGHPARNVLHLGPTWHRNACTNVGIFQCFLQQAAFCEVALLLGSAQILKETIRFIRIAWYQRRRPIRRGECVSSSWNEGARQYCVRQALADFKARFRWKSLSSSWTRTRASFHTEAPTCAGVGVPDVVRIIAQNPRRRTQMERSPRRI